MREQVVSNQDRAKALALPDAERIVLKDANGNDATMVVLGVTECVGRDFALVAPESELGQPGRTPSVCVYEYHTNTKGGPELIVVQDEEVYEEALHMFMDLIEPEDDTE